MYDRITPGPSWSDPRVRHAKFAKRALHQTTTLSGRATDRDFYDYAVSDPSLDVNGSPEHSPRGLRPDGILFPGRRESLIHFTDPRPEHFTASEPCTVIEVADRSGWFIFFFFLLPFPTGSVPSARSQRRQWTGNRTRASGGHGFDLPAQMTVSIWNRKMTA